MKMLKFILLALIALEVIAAITGIQSLRVNLRSGSAITSITRFSDSGGILCSGFTIILALILYGVQKRMIAIWWCGWVVLIVGPIATICGVIAETQKNTSEITFPSFWLPVGIMILATILISISWANWWKQQKSYFLTKNN